MVLPQLVFAGTTKLKLKRQHISRHITDTTAINVHSFEIIAILKIISLKDTYKLKCRCRC